MTTDDQELREYLKDALGPYAALSSLVPHAFFDGRRSKLTARRMNEFVDDRMTRYFHQLNLPMALAGTRQPDSEDVRDLMGSLLATLDQFCGQFKHVPGARSLLAPLWEDPWTPTPQIWSIAACALFAQRAVPAGLEIEGFEQLIGGGPQDSDITGRLRGRRVHIEVEAWHLPRFDARPACEITKDYERRVTDKAASKFLELPNGETGIIAEVAVVSEIDVERTIAELQRPMKVPDSPGVHALSFRLVGVRSPRLSYHLTGT